MISHKHKFIFIHIPKCAGTSIESVLGHLENHEGRGGQDHRPLRQIEKPLLQKSVLTSPENLREVWRSLQYRFKKKKNIRNKFQVNSPQFNEYYKFSFVRNPWSRAFSWYKNVINDPVHLKNLNVPENQSFKKFLNTQAGKRFLLPQTYWLKNFEGKIEFDYIGKFEDLQNDFREICHQLSLNTVQLPHKLPGSKEDYRNFYDSEMIDIVRNIYLEEIKLFDYKFEK